MKFFVAFAALIAVAVANPLYTWSLADLTEAVNNPNTNPALLPYLQFALSELTNTIANGIAVDAIVVPTPADLEEYSAPSSWTLQELSQALQDPHTKPEYVPALEAALDSLMSALASGQNVNSIVVNMPVQNIEIEPIPVFPEPEIQEPEIPVPEIPAIVLPAPETPVSSPLVQVIVNVNGQQQQVTDVAHEIEPTPVQVVDDIPADVLADLR
ncbi:cytadherence high molecular weight protein 1-like [Pararge aegeria]|uniref:cytadherence high molecular weight protein 1-like n=1 Tax=Pararge aegeria TaxID=116150 RepID=UPI0019D00A98|nr:cytadherence high molecular weight protein 1-like [Pararge aegeria]